MYGIKRKVNIHDKEETSLKIKKTMVGANWKDVSEEKVWEEEVMSKKLATWVFLTLVTPNDNAKTE